MFAVKARTWCFPLLIMSCLVGGCFVDVHRGVYDPVNAPTGWKVRQQAECTQFFDEAARGFKPRWYISVATHHKGEIYVCLYTGAWDPEKLFRQTRILGSTVKVTMHDQQNRENIIHVKASREVGFFGQQIEVGGSEDFTITLPPFQVGDVAVDAVPLHLKWSDRRYYEISPLMK